MNGSEEQRAVEASGEQEGSGNPVPTYRKIYDFSQYNGVVNWPRLKEAGVDFVMLRAGYGRNNIDKKFRANAAACIRYGIPFGIYWFSYAYLVSMAEKEAQFALEAVRPYKPWCPVAFDFEGASVAYAAKMGVRVGKTLATGLVRAFCSRVKSGGYDAWFYSDENYLGRMFDEALILEYPLWFARYNAVSGRDDMIMWQYSSKGRVPGVAGNVDMNYGYF